MTAQPVEPSKPIEAEQPAASVEAAPAKALSGAPEAVPPAVSEVAVVETPAKSADAAEANTAAAEVVPLVSSSSGAALVEAPAINTPETTAATTRASATPTAQPIIAVEEVKPPTPWNRFWSLLRVGPKGVILRLYDQFMRKLSGTPVWKYSRITPNLYVGGQHVNLKGMDLEGITAIVNMREDYYSDEKRGIGGKRHLHLATRDNTPPSIEALDKGADFIHQEITTGGKVYIHCGVGIGRAPSMAAAYLIKYENMTSASAMALITKTRPFIHLTRKQYQQLDAFEEASRKAKKEAGEAVAQKPISPEAKENIVLTK
jgi:protein-tyrosine phosphatase